MTRHNLQPCLQWLLQNNSTWTQPVDYASIPISSIDLESTPDSSETSFKSTHSILTGSNISRTSAHLAGTEDDGGRDLSDMAKLQLAPQRTKRTMLQGQNNHMKQLPSPAPSRSPNQSVSLSSAPRKQQPTTFVDLPEPSVSNHFEDVYEPDDYAIEDNIFDIEEVDLSVDVSFEDFGPPTRLWREDAAWRPEPITKGKGRKRTSDEFEADLFTAQETRPNHEQSPGEQEFSDNQPPASTARPMVKRHSGSGAPDALGVTDVQNGNAVDEEVEIVETTVRTETRRCRSSQRNVRSLAEELGPFNNSISPSHQRPAKPSSSMPHLSQHDISPAKRPNLAQTIDRKSVFSPKKVLDHLSTPGTRSTHVGQRNEDDKPELWQVPSHEASPVRASQEPVAVKSRVPQDLQSPGFQHEVNTERKMLDKPAKDKLKRFIELPDARLEDLMARLEESSKSYRKQIADQLCEEEVASPELTWKSKIVKDRINGLRELQLTRKPYLDRCDERLTAKSRLDELLEDGYEVDPEDASSEITQLCSTIRELKKTIDTQEVVMFRLMQQAGLSDVGSNSPVPYASESRQGYDTPLKQPRDILVASTQHGSGNALRKMLSPKARQVLAGAQPITQTPPSRPTSQLRAGADLPPFSHKAPLFELKSPLPSIQAVLEPVNELYDDEPTKPNSPMFTRFMGAAPTAFSVAEDFDEEMGEDPEFLDIAEAFEQEQRHPQPSGRLVLSQMDNNVRRQAHTPIKGSLVGIDEPLNHLLQFPWSKDVASTLKRRFHLRGFRHNQLEAINATLGGKDAFVLMPTGGGKSLCYQLPSVIQSGKTAGLTIVISPLLSLMHDQVEHLKELGIQAFLINGEASAEHRRSVLSALREPHVERFIQLLYVTPEMLNRSKAILGAFEDLHKRNKLARIVIDEAHCVSQWGHDFRPDYKELGDVRARFSDVPVMALTATATETVKMDTIHNLGMKNCEVFTQSFNRPNLIYEVRQKQKAAETLNSIVNTIKSLHKGQSGIIYCLSRKNCEKIAEQLRKEHRIRADHYHAGMDSESRMDVQTRWQKGQVDIIVATIAFGMGIDKPDVRFVIHHTVPKSLEGYYQETGRAGRDGRKSNCYLYYGYADTMQLKRMIDQGDGSFEQKERQKHMLRNVVQFCENKVDCRRVQVLNYFNEHFSSDDCKESCDTCLSDSSFKVEDYSNHAISIIQLVRKIAKDEVTLLHCVDLYRGAKPRKAIGAELSEFGQGADLERGDIERMFYRLVGEDALEEYNVVNRAGFAVQYLRVGEKARDYETRRKSLKLHIRLSPNKKTSAKTQTKKRLKRTQAPGPSHENEETHHPASTNVSSPIQSRAKGQSIRAGKRKIVRDENPENDESDEHDLIKFPPVRIAGQKSKRSAPEAGSPITADSNMQDLSDIHLCILENFVDAAREKLGKLVINKSLKRQPVSDTTLRAVGVAFPQTREAMLEISGIDEDRYELYGNILLKLSRQAYQNYREMMKGEDKPRDPNRDNILVISDDDEAFEDNANSSNYGSEPDFSETSQYFTGPENADFFRRQGKVEVVF